MLREIRAGMVIGGRKVIVAQMRGVCPLCGRFTERGGLIIINRATDGQLGKKRWNHAECDPDVRGRDAQLVAKKAQPQLSPQLSLFEE